MSHRAEHQPRYALAVMVAIALMLTSCAGGGSGSTAEPTAPSDPNATFRFGSATDGGKNYDPVSSGNPYAPVFLLPAYDRLFDVDAAGQVVPMLAASSALSADQLSLTLTLRDNVTFHDGTRFDAAAVQANIQRGQTNPRSSVKGNLSTIWSMEVVDPATIKLNLTEPNGALPAILSDRAGMMVSPAAMSNPDLDLMPVGAGPYKVVADEPGVKVSYEKFDGYYNPNPQSVKRIEMNIQLDPEARLRSLETGQVDAAAINMDQLAAAKTKGIAVAPGPETSSASFVIFLNMAKTPALADPKVRGAMSLALDRNGINKGLLNGACDPSAQIFPSSNWAASTSVPSSALDNDPARAKSLLAEAGYPDGFEMSLAAINAQQYSNVAEAVAEQLGRIGVRVKLQLTNPVQLVGNFVAQKTTDAYVAIWPGANDPSTTVESLYLPTGLYNPGGLNIPEITSLAAEGRAGQDRSARAKSYQSLSNATVQNHMQLPICSASLPNAVNGKVKKLRQTPATVPDLRNVEMTG